MCIYVIGFPPSTSEYYKLRFKFNLRCSGYKKPKKKIFNNKSATLFVKLNILLIIVLKINSDKGL